MAPVTAIFAGLFLDDVALRVETRHYPRDRARHSAHRSRSIAFALQFAAVVLAVNLAILPLVFTGIGAAALVAANAYLIGREYFEMVAMRHMPVDEARLLRQENTPRIFAAGIVPALLALVPIAQSRRAPFRHLLFRAHLQAGAGVFGLNLQISAIRQRQHSRLARLAHIAPMQDQPVMGMMHVFRRARV